MTPTPIDLPGLLRLLGREDDPAALSFRSVEKLRERYPEEAERKALAHDTGLVALCLLLDLDCRPSEAAALLGWPADRYPLLLVRAHHAQQIVYDAEKQQAAGTVTDAKLALIERSRDIRAYLISRSLTAPVAAGAWGGG